jgi:hypothetical protein
VLTKASLDGIMSPSPLLQLNLDFISTLEVNFPADKPQ